MRKFNSKLIKIEAIRQDISLKTMATALGCSYNHFTDKVRGKVGISSEELGKIASYLKVSPDRFFDEVEDELTVAGHLADLADLADDEPTANQTTTAAQYAWKRYAVPVGKPKSQRGGRK